ncbi:sensor histidine kinase [Cellulosimicrobium cellulans]|uniref:sensor histidine kinase n=1 Tax=Cellulosimicrobium cellulans TaxID=1710 RepID=UPI000AB5F32B|nr:histidine kinase [Cellulosimicrobium cellulans]
MLVGVLVGVAVLESTARRDLAWPVASGLVAVALVSTLPWRRIHPLLVVAVTTLLSAGFQVAQAAAGTGPDGLATMLAVLLVPYALFRWGTGRDRLLGGAILAVSLVLSVTLGGEGIQGAIAGVAFLGGACLVGALRRERVVARASQLEAVRAAERESLARDLHDTVAHHVSAIAIRAQVAATEPGDARRVAESLGVIEREAQAVLTDMRSLVRSLRAPAGLGPSPGMAELAALADPGPPAVTVRLDGTVDLPDIVAASLFRIAQEAVTNARRHADGARAIDVAVTVDGDDVLLVVHDDGAGARSPAGSGHGLQGIAERAALLGGEVAAGPDPDGGWTVRARLPRWSAA